MKTYKKQTPRNRKPTIYWEDIRFGYNGMYNTNYINMPIFIEAVYDKYKTIVKCAAMLGVSSSAFHKQLKFWHIQRKPKGHRGLSEGLKAIQAIKNTKEMTAKEIAKETGFNRNYICALLRRYRISYLKGARRNSGLYNRIAPQNSSCLENYNAISKLPF